MSVTTHDLAVGIAALIAFPLAINLPAVLASDGSPDRGLPRLEHGEGAPVHPARFTAHLPR
jgi:hypothetical protein